MRKLKFGMVGGGNGAFIGNVHRHGAVMDDLAELAAGCFTRNPEKNLETARQWGIPDESRVYANYMEMAEKPARRTGTFHREKQAGTCKRPGTCAVHVSGMS